MLMTNRKAFDRSFLKKAVYSNIHCQNPQISVVWYLLLKPFDILLHNGIDGSARSVFYYKLKIIL